MTASPLVEVDNIVKFYGSRHRGITALAGVSVAIPRGETFALVGESGCGKSTFGKILLRLETPTEGAIRVAGLDYARLTDAQSLDLRRKVQVVLQDPFAAMNPRQRVGAFVAEPMRPANVHGDRAGRMAAARAALDRVGISPDAASMFPHEFSGGQRQRISIARALSVDPEFLVLDEPVSALDVSVRAQILNLLRDLQEKQGLTYLFISHDLAIVEFMADAVGVMYLGRLVETGRKAQVFRRPLHPYTKAMLDLARANETGGRAAPVIRGEIPSPTQRHPGCPYSARCPAAVERCEAELPEFRQIAGAHGVACHRAEELDGRRLPVRIERASAEIRRIGGGHK